MPRWYKGFLCGGIKPEMLVSRIEDLVHLHDLGLFVPVVRYEKRGNKRGFYLFLAIESAQIGDVPEDVRRILFQLSWLTHPVYDFTLDQIRSMTGAEYDVHSYVRSIPYMRPALPAISNPFECEYAGRVDEPVRGGDVVVRTQRYDRLLLWLSAAGEGSWRVFQNTWQMLGGGDGEGSQQILRRLRLLGHIETSRDRQRWSAAPTLLTPISSGEQSGQFVLCGRRDTALLKALEQVTVIDVLPQAQGDGPSTIYLRTTSPEQLRSALERMGKSVHCVEQVGLRLAQRLPALDRWKNTLESLQGIRPHAFTVKRFDGTGFVEIDFTSASGFYELWPLDDNGRTAARPEYTLFYDEANDHWLRADWYGLRFLARYDAGQSSPVQYAPEIGWLAIPQDWRWPEIYERALVLASGRLPIRHNGWLIYDGISWELLDELRDKLRLSYEEFIDA